MSRNLALCKFLHCSCLSIAKRNTTQAGQQKYTLVKNHYQRLNTHQIVPVIPAATRIASSCNFLIPMLLVLKKRYLTLN